jgi:hypothetical protein
LFLSTADNDDWIAKTPGDVGFRPLLRRGGRCCCGEYDDLRADGDVVVKVGDVIVGHADAAG